MYDIIEFEGDLETKFISILKNTIQDNIHYHMNIWYKDGKCDGIDCEQVKFFEFTYTGFIIHSLSNDKMFITYNGIRNIDLIDMDK